MTDESQLQVRPKDGDSSLSLSKVRSGLIARGRRDAAILASEEGDLLPLTRLLDAAILAYKEGDRLPLARLLAELTRLLAEEGDAEAQFDLGFKYAEGRGVAQDDGEALKWFRPAAEQGHPGAQFCLGVMYHEGRGTPRDYTEALKWILLAAEQTDPFWDFGDFYDSSFSLKWFRLAAEQGHSAGQCILGKMYAEGVGVAKDYVQAHMWFNLAAAGGSAEGSRCRSIVTEQMTPPEIAEAQRLARNWRPIRGAD